VNVSEVQTVPAIKTELNRVVVEEVPAPVETAPSVPQEIVDAVNRGQELMAAEQYKEAVVEFEKALPALPDNMSLKQITAQAYYKAGELKKAIELLEVVTAAPETSAGVRLLLINLYLENSQLDEAKASLAKLPADAAVDATVFMNIGILFLNKNNPGEAASVLTKAVDMDVTRADILYYRGLANLQLKKNKEAKADFEKVLALAPDSPEGRDAKQLIDSLK
jgi:tetratricopeptide (TPR) repeat protein